MTRNIILTPELLAAIPDMVERDMTGDAIAATLGVTPGTLKVQCCRKGISLRKRKKVAFLIRHDAFTVIRRHAAKRSIAVENLMSRLIEVVAKDDMVNAILDDKEEAA